MLHCNNKYKPLSCQIPHAPIGYPLVDVRLTRPTPHKGTAVVALTRSSTKLVLQSCTLGCLSKVSMMKRL